VLRGSVDAGPRGMFPFLRTGRQKSLIKSVLFDGADAVAIDISGPGWGVSGNTGR
jgi:hypothetical protein